MVAIGFKGKECIGLKSQKLNLWDALTTLNHLENFKEVYHGEKEDDPKEVKFVACGKNEILDADMNYSLDQSTNSKFEESKVGQKRTYKYIEPVQGPINAPYKQFMEKRNDLNN